jgi:CRISPR-associated protein Csm3
MTRTAFHRKFRITGTLIFDTAFHIGSGKEGELATDMGVLKDGYGWPVLPGSTLKGCFRATAEKLAGHLGMSACLLDTQLSGEKCVGDQSYFTAVNSAFREQKSEKEKLLWLAGHTCDICALFGSPLQASRIFFSDGHLARWQSGYQVRDGVVIDRDSGTARPKLKYDYEVTARDTTYEILIDVENPEDKDLAILAAVIAEWKNGFRLGGFTSRGLGHVVLEGIHIGGVDYRDPEQLKDYLIKRAMRPCDDLLENALQEALTVQGGKAC